MKTVAIVGAGPTGIYTFFSLIKANEPISISIYEQAKQAGIGMPYNDDENSRMMLANIASIEIPPLTATYLDWLRDQKEQRLARYGVDKTTLHERQFLPRILLGEYFRDQFLALVDIARNNGFDIAVHESCEVTNLEATVKGVKLWADGEPVLKLFDLAVIATGHVWPEEDKASRTYFPSPWSGLIDTRIPPSRVGIMGTSLSAIDAAMAVVAQHGSFIEEDDETLRFDLAPQNDGLTITLMSRSGILPEADFYCPIPYQPLKIATEQAIEQEVQAGSSGLLDRIFALIAGEIGEADPAWSKRISLSTLNADSFATAYFSDRQKHDAFHWAQYNLKEVERNKRDKHTIPWRYAILRLHEAIHEIVPHLNEQDRERFNGGLCKVFVDNYAAIPSQSIRRLLALRKAGLIDLLELGCDYEMDIKYNHTDITMGGDKWTFDVFIDARGQKPLKTKDLPFPTLRQQLLSCGDDIPDVGDDYTLQAPEVARGKIAFGALPYLMHDRPFVQGITASADIGAAIAKATKGSAHQMRRRLPFIDLF
ncbi:FAD-NAD(P)-binding protein [Brucella sp. BE17]|uniref:FAD-NAD(P)-binding protein n=1 Tax=Brucella sp. BE17 TaxID=3142977 RepID=UPI0031BAA254